MTGRKKKISHIISYLIFILSFKFRHMKYEIWVDREGMDRLLYFQLFALRFCDNFLLQLFFNAMALWLKTVRPTLLYPSVFFNKHFPIKYPYSDALSSF